MNQNYSNKGMYLEEVINKTISFYRSRNICYCEKRFIPFKILKKINQTNFIGFLTSKSLVDYFGFYKNKHFEFEAKETVHDYFSMGTIQQHQYDWLDYCSTNRIKTYVIIYFSKQDDFFVVPFTELKKQKRYSKILYTFFQKNFSSLKLEFPGIIDFIKKM